MKHRPAVRRCATTALAAMIAAALGACSSGSDNSRAAEPTSARSTATISPKPERVVVRRALVYGHARVRVPKAASVPLLLDVYEPASQPSVLRPVVVLIHGGGFTMQSRTDDGIVRIARALAARGVVALSIDYRLLQQSPVLSDRVAPVAAALPKAPVFVAMTAAVDDTLTALDYLDAHRAELGVDPHALGLIGSSAGAITADHVAYALDDHHVDRPTIRFVASLGGGMFVTPPAGEGGRAATQLEQGEAALFAVHGSADDQVPVELDDQLVARANAEHVPAEYHRVPGGGHGYIASQFFTRKVAGDDTAFDRLIEFAIRFGRG
jgi:acetyl esterase/lipase